MTTREAGPVLSCFYLRKLGHREASNLFKVTQLISSRGPNPTQALCTRPRGPTEGEAQGTEGGTQVHPGGRWQSCDQLEPPASGLLCPWLPLQRCEPPPTPLITACEREGALDGTFSLFPFQTPQTSKGVSLVSHFRNVYQLQFIIVCVGVLRQRGASGAGRGWPPGLASPQRGASFPMQATKPEHRPRLLPAELS